MAYRSLYRKWRPQTFEDIVGQEHITNTLKNEIVSGHISHAYLFCGSRGTGKTTTAKVFAKAVNCENPVNGSPCNRCRTCIGISDGSLLDVVEMDAASNNSVENVREINEEISYLPAGMKYKVYIVDEVHMLSPGAFNALLKTLEEPPEHAIFILATTEIHKVPVTILSRCQRFDFRLVPDSKMTDSLKYISGQEGFSVSDSSYSMIVRAAKGGMRDAVSILDQCASYNGGTVTDEIVRSVTGLLGSDFLLSLADAIYSHSFEKALMFTDEVLKSGCDVLRVMECMAQHYRNLIVANSPDCASLLDAGDTDREKIVRQAEQYGTERAVFCLEEIMKSYETARFSANSRLILESVIIRLSHPKADASFEPVMKRIDEIEKRLDSGEFAAPMAVFEEEYTPDIPGEAEDEYIPDLPEDAEDEYIPDISGGAEEETPPPQQYGDDRGDSSVIFDRWTEVLEHIRAQNNMLSMALMSSSFRVSGSKLIIIGLVPYLKTKESSRMIKDAVCEVCDAVVDITYDETENGAPDIPKEKIENDPLAALAAHSDELPNINIKGDFNNG